MSDSTSNTPTTLTELWEQLKALMETLDKDLQKNGKGNVSAGVRVRKSLRTMKKVCSVMVKHTTETDKALVAARKESNKKSEEEKPAQ